MKKRIARIPHLSGCDVADYVFVEQVRGKPLPEMILPDVADSCRADNQQWPILAVGSRDQNCLQMTHSIRIKLCLVGESIRVSLSFRLTKDDVYTRGTYKVNKLLHGTDVSTSPGPKKG